MVAADGIDDERDASPFGQPGEFKCPVAGAVIDRLMQAAFLEEGMFAAAGRSEDPGAEMACDVNGGKPDPSTSVVNQDRFIRL